MKIIYVDFIRQDKESSNIREKVGDGWLYFNVQFKGTVNSEYEGAFCLVITDNVADEVIYATVKNGGVKRLDTGKVKIYGDKLTYVEHEFIRKMKIKNVL
jgi:hypothetical protein